MVERLTAAGAMDITGVTYNGYSYDYASLGRPVRVPGARPDEKVQADGNGKLVITVADSEAVIVKRQP